MAQTPGSARPASARTRSAGYLPTLDGWRAIAIGLVIFDHAFNNSMCAAGNAYWCNRFNLGQTGVNLFFGVSGFLICSRLLEEFQRTGAISLRGFYVRRAFRILPPALLYLAVITTLALAHQIVVSRTELAGTLFFFRNYLGLDAGFYTIHFWSLSIEEQFYLVWPTLLIVLLALPRFWPVTCTVLLAVCVASWRQASLLHDIMTHGHLASGFMLRTDVRADGLLLGAALAIALRTKAAQLGRMPRWLWGTTAGVYIVVVGYFGQRPTIWEAALVPPLIAWTAYHQHTWPSSLLELPILRWIGRLSYSLYIWQEFFFPPKGVAAPLHSLQRWPLAVPAALACAVASYYLLELPAIRLGHRLAPPTTQGRGDLSGPEPALVETSTAQAATVTPHSTPSTMPSTVRRARRSAGS